MVREMSRLKAQQYRRVQRSPRLRSRHQHNTKEESRPWTQKTRRYYHVNHREQQELSQKSTQTNRNNQRKTINKNHKRRTQLLKDSWTEEPAASISSRDWMSKMAEHMACFARANFMLRVYLSSQESSRPQSPTIQSATCDSDSLKRQFLK